MKKLAIIIPVYNTSKYLEKCIKSIEAQKLDDYEVIIVDDGSTDGSSQECDKYQSDIIKVIHIENGGVSNARNQGILASDSKYITFVDSDDYIDPCYNELMNYLDEGADLVSFGISIDNEKTHLEDRCIIGEDLVTTYNKSGYIEKIVDISYFNCVIWNKIYKSSIIKENNILFDKNIHVAEDTLFAVTYSLNILKAVHVNKPYYHYIIHANSALRVKNSSFIKRVETSIPAYQKVQELLKFDEKLYALAVIQGAHARLGLSEHYYNFKYDNYKSLIKENKAWIKNHKSYINKYAPKKEKLRIRLFLTSTKLSCMIVNMRNKKRSS